MKNNKTFYIIISILVIQIIVVYIYQLLPESTYKIVDSFDKVPKNIAGFEFQEDIIMDPFSIQALGADTLLFKRYTQPVTKKSILMVIVYHKDERWGTHTPEGCYTSQGWHMDEERTSETIGNDDIRFDVNQLLISKSNIKDIVYYWYFDDSVQTPNRLYQWVNQLGKAIIRKQSGYGMIRISTAFDDEAAKKDLTVFSTKMFQTIPEIFVQ